MISRDDLALDIAALDIADIFLPAWIERRCADEEWLDEPVDKSVDPTAGGWPAEVFAVL
jgi:hypothetical protein